MFFLHRQLTTDAEIIKSCKELGLKGKELIDFFKESQTRAAAEAEKARAEVRAEAEKARAEAEKARAKAAKQRELEYRLLKIQLGLVSEFDDSIEELHNESSKSADIVRKLEEENELKIELADPKQEKAVLPSISGSELSRQITSSRESPTKGENVFPQRKVSDVKETSPSQDLLFQPETFAEREATLSRDMSIPPALSKQEENEDEVFSSSTEIEYGGTPIPNCERIYMRENEERVCFVKKTISSEKESGIERSRVEMPELEPERRVESIANSEDSKIINEDFETIFASSLLINDFQEHDSIDSSAVAREKIENVTEEDVINVESNYDLPVEKKCSHSS